MAWNADSRKWHRCGTSIAEVPAAVRALAASSLDACPSGLGGMPMAFGGRSKR